MPSLPLVSIIIVNFKNYELTRQCLKSLQSTNYSNLEIIVVDNESDVSKLNDLQSEFIDAKFFPIQENLYYAGGNNYGISKSRGEFICLLNNDTVVTPGWLSPLLLEAQKNPNVLYQPKILLLNENDRPPSSGSKLYIGSAGDAMQVFGFGYQEGLGLEDKGQFDEKRIIFFPSGACVFTSRKMLDLLGGLDSKFFTFYEDVNLGWKALLLGYKSFYIPESVIFHKWGGSFGKSLSPTKFQFIERSRINVLLLNLSRKSLIIMIPSFLIVECLIAVYSLSNGFFGAKLRASLEVIKNLPMLINERKKIQTSRKISDKEISELMSLTIHHPYLGKHSEKLNAILSFLAKIYKHLI